MTTDRSTGSPGHPLSLDAGRLFCAADGGALVVMDRDSGKMLKSLPLVVGAG